MGSYAGIYYLVADNQLAGDYLVIQVLVDGPAVVVGRWDERTDAERDADRWTALEASAA